MNNEVTISGYRPEYAAAFKALNIEWIEKFFAVEPHDMEQLDNPETYIINKGGSILFAVYEGKAVGTCALVKTGEAEYELVKMGVSPAVQGKHIGKKLCEAALKEARALGARRVWLESNRRLEVALNLYRSLGFKEIPMTTTPYARADIRMEVWL
ncbi:GNAT family N-acetyltransferase [Deminuibacter soli]|uniref:GNAT family N-acetyltransferase n=1 Tax=Deminuibacter soli TaxID=2291815 RepID=A0A3E1NDX6_9BACT|nr:GNAT family N-acetyltransferase [Deminuibacter soli]RFM25978.1 GNAT family N-acetyltransferase [Deminuibacter soli]